MKKMRKMIVCLLCLMMAISVSAVAVFASAETASQPGEWGWVPADYKYNAGAEGFEDLKLSLTKNGEFSVRFSINTSLKPVSDPNGGDFNSRNTTSVQKNEGIGQYLYYNGQKYADMATKPKFNLHLRNVEFWVYADGHTFKDGDVMEFRKGMYFPVAEKDGLPIKGYEGRLGTTFSVERVGGAWVIAAVSGTEAKLTSVSTVTEKAASAVYPAAFEFTTQFDIRMADATLENLELVDAYANNLFIGDKSVKQLNTQFADLTTEDGDEIPAIKISTSGNKIVFTVAKSTEIIKADTSFSLKVGKDFVSNSGMIIGADIVRHYIPSLEYWSTKAPYATPKTNAVEVKTASDFAVIDKGANGSFDITFNSPIADQQYLAYNFHPAHIPTLPGGYESTKAIAADLASGGYTESLINNVVIDNKTIAEYWETLGSVEAKSNAFQIHILNGNILSVRAAVSTFSENADISVKLKKGLTFFGGNYLTHDIDILYKGATDKSTVVTYSTESIEISADKTNLNLNDKATLSIAAVPAAAPKTIEVSDPTVISVVQNEEGAYIITALKNGTATIKVTSGTTVSNILTINVKKLVTDITLGATTLKVDVGANATISATKVPGDATDAITFTSSDTSIATVDASGKVTGVKAGTATITVKCGEIEKTVTVTVSEKVEEKKGCGSTVVGASVIGLVALLGCLAVVIARKKSKANN